MKQEIGCVFGFGSDECVGCGDVLECIQLLKNYATDLENKIERMEKGTFSSSLSTSSPSSLDDKKTQGDTSP